jgi:type IV fimbrial biogenesis protein FimT
LQLIAMRARGFTLIELMIALVIVAVLLMLMAPNYAEFMRNARIRNVADAIAGGIRLAQTEAVRRNQNVEFILAANGFQVRDPVTPAILHDEPFSDAIGQVAVTGSPAPAVKLTYSPIGQMFAGQNPDDASDVLTSVAVRHVSLAARELRVITDVFGGTRVCDNDMTVHVSLRCPVGVP